MNGVKTVKVTLLSAADAPNQGMAGEKAEIKNLRTSGMHFLTLGVNLNKDYRIQNKIKVTNLELSNSNL